MSISQRLKLALEDFRTSTVRSNADHLGGVADEALAAKVITATRYAAIYGEIHFWLDPVYPLFDPL